MKSLYLKNLSSMFDPKKILYLKESSHGNLEGPSNDTLDEALIDEIIEEHFNILEDQLAWY